MISRAIPILQNQLIQDVMRFDQRGQIIEFGKGPTPDNCQPGNLPGLVLVVSQ
jgi:hypothetical protein